MRIYKKIVTIWRRVTRDRTRRTIRLKKNKGLEKLMQFEEDIIKLWNLALPLIRDEISDVSYKTWIEPIRPVLLKGSTICFTAEDFAVVF